MSKVRKIMKHKNINGSNTGEKLFYWVCTGIIKKPVGESKKKEVLAWLGEN